MSDIRYRSAFALAEDIKRGVLTSSEVLECFLGGWTGSTRRSTLSCNWTPTGRASARPVLRMGEHGEDFAALVQHACLGASTTSAGCENFVPRRSRTSRRKLVRVVSFFPDADRATSAAMRDLERRLDQAGVKLLCSPAEPELEVNARVAYVGKQGECDPPVYSPEIEGLCPLP